MLLLLSLFSRVWVCATPQTAAHQDPLSLAFSRQDYWSRFPFPSPMHACMLSHFSRVQLCATLWTAVHQASLSMWFSRQEYWSGLPFPSPIHACMLSRFSHVWLCTTIWTAALQAPLSTGFSRQEYRSGLSFPSPTGQLGSEESTQVLGSSPKLHVTFVLILMRYTWNHHIWISLSLNNLIQ